MSFDRLGKTIHSFAAQLHKAGVGPGTVVAPFRENPAIFYALVWAICRLGATAACLASIDAAHDDGLKIDFAVTLPDRPAKNVRNLVFGQDWLGAPVGEVPGEGAGQFIFTSSGTTGRPKYYLARQDVFTSWVAARDGLLERKQLDTLVMLPVFSAYGLFGALQCHESGGMVCWPRESAAATLDSIDSGRRTEIMCTPSGLQDLLAAFDRGRHKFTLDRIILGGSTVAKELARQAEAAFGCPVYNVYGSTEAGAHAILRVADSELPKGHVGKVVPGVGLAVEDLNGEAVAAGGEGLVKVTAPEGCRIDRTLIGESPYDGQGRFVPGDLGYFTPEGELILSGRINEVINSAGSKVAPDQYESLALKFINATQIAAFGIPNSLGTEDVGLAIVAEGPLDEGQLRANLSRAVGTHLQFHVFRVQALPVNASGKIDRAALLRQLAREA
ncbi:MAG: acyl--CoA ligase [Alphaproteobacteria bacterium]|nr:acyl--CoA ligase [Alphaproteobacteria bacterium]